MKRRSAASGSTMEIESQDETFCCTLVSETCLVSLIGQYERFLEKNTSGKPPSCPRILSAASPGLHLEARGRTGSRTQVGATGTGKPLNSKVGQVVTAVSVRAETRSSSSPPLRPAESTRPAGTGLPEPPRQPPPGSRNRLEHHIAGFCSSDVTLSQGLLPVGKALRLL